MPPLEEWFRQVSPETKALVLLNEYRVGAMDADALRRFMCDLTANDLERIGLLEVVRSTAGAMGFSEAETDALLRSLKTDPPPRIHLQAPTLPRRSRKTSRVGRFEPPAPIEPVEPVEPIERTAPPVPSDPIIPPSRKQTRSIRRTTSVFFPPPSATPEAAPPPLPGTPENAEPAGKTDAAGNAPAGAAGLVHRPRLLLADASDPVRRGYREALLEQGFRVDEARDGEEAWRMLQANRYDLLIMDVKLPLLHGLELLARLQREGGELRVLICTAHGALQQDVVVRNYPRLRFVRRPLPLERFVTFVREAVSETGVA